jgi:hypothetical protein
MASCNPSSNIFQYSFLGVSIGIQPTTNSEPFLRLEQDVNFDETGTLPRPGQIKPLSITIATIE